MPPMLVSINIKNFLKTYWQKQPLLIKQAYPAYINPLPAQQLMLIACAKNAEARIILEKGGKQPWELRHGPFSKNTFKKMPATHWTLLVQGTNVWNHELALLLEDFYFIPQWRIEDVMTSFAVKGGNVGAHVDNYDVFLLQAEGQREWRISNKPTLIDDFLPEHEVKLLKKFKEDKKFILNPGDMLYLPPRFAHHGIALTDNCITHSIGFRAPSLPEMLDDYLTYLLSSIDTRQRYSDADLKLQAASGEINAHTLRKVVQYIEKSIDDKQKIKRWFGQFVTQNKYTALTLNDEEINAAQLRVKIKAGTILLKNPAARFAYVQNKNNIFFYANGEEYCLPTSMLAFVKTITGTTANLQKNLAVMAKNQKFLELLTELVNAGCFYFAAE